MANTENEIASALLPAWVVRRIKEWVFDKKSGELCMVFSDGGVRGLKKNEYEQPPKKAAD